MRSILPVNMLICYFVCTCYFVYLYICYFVLIAYPLMGKSCVLESHCQAQVVWNLLDWDRGVNESWSWDLWKWSLWFLGNVQILSEKLRLLFNKLIFCLCPLANIWLIQFKSLKYASSMNTCGTNFWLVSLSWFLVIRRHRMSHFIMQG